MRILVIRRDNIGDLVCTTPLLAALRERYPAAHIAALVNSYNAAVLDGNPHVDEVHRYTKLKHRSPGESAAAIVRARLKMMARLRQHTFDYIILGKAGFDSHGLGIARWLKRRHIVGFEPAGKDVQAITLKVPGEPDPAHHEVEVMQELGRAVDVPRADGPLRVYPDPSRTQAWRTRLARPALRERPVWIAIHVSARQSSRQFVPERWVELIRRLTASGEAGVVLLWSPGAAADSRHPGDDEKAAAILAALKGAEAVMPAPTSELADLIAVLSLCNGFIGADGGAMHLAAALGLPIVAVFEDLQIKRQRWYPWQARHELVSPAAGDIADISIDQVVQAWQKLGSRGARPE
jgi:ADP-heptose:LPS heptosyltransferase